VLIATAANTAKSTSSGNTKNRLLIGLLLGSLNSK